MTFFPKAGSRPFRTAQWGLPCVQTRRWLPTQSLSHMLVTVARLRLCVQCHGRLKSPAVWLSVREAIAYPWPDGSVAH